MADLAQNHMAGLVLPGKTVIRDDYFTVVSLYFEF